MRIILTIVIMLCSSCFLASAQQPQPNQPIDLPEFIVTGKERIEVPSSAKQAPSKPPSMKAQLLDSLNPTEKHPLPKLPARSLPSPTRLYPMWPGYLEAGIGNYVTPTVAAGYSLKSGGYRFDLNGIAEAATSAWVPNAEYLKAGADVLSTYTAPSEFVVFGGSTTEVDLGLRLRQYRLYATAAAPKRNTTALRAGVGVKGEYEGFNYDGGASYASVSMGTDSVTGVAAKSDVTDNMLRGYLTLEQRWERYDVGARLDLRFASFAEKGYPFVEGLVFARYSNDVIRVSAGAGAQTFTSTTDISRFGLLLTGELDVFLGRALTLQGFVRSGLRPRTFADLLEENPYVAANTVLDAAYDVFDVRGTLVLRPSLAIAATVGIRVRQSDREHIWSGDSTGTFSVLYRSVTRLQIPAEVRWLMTSRDVLSADISFTVARVDSTDQPYVPGVSASIAYERSWTPFIRSTIAGIYIGDRFADIDNKTTLSGYVDVRLRAEMDITSALSAHLRADNVISNTIVLWHGYRERGAFLSGGITWKF